VRPGSDWTPGLVTLGIAGAAGFLLGVVVLVIARGVVHDEVRTVTRTVEVQVQALVPDVLGAKLGDAEARVHDAGYDVDVVGGGFFGPEDDDEVVDQDPAPGAALPGGATVTLQVD
jgi:beta-lactam-binding protein with PASTA domain